MNIYYTVVRSDRKTLSVHISDSCEVTVRAPLYVSNLTIKKFVKDNSALILDKMERIRKKREEVEASGGRLSEEELRMLTEEAKRIIPGRVEYYASIVGVKYNRITIRHQKTRWGSCTRDGNLNFNCLLLLAPYQAMDGVIVHELCHLKEMNHSKDFYDEVLKYYPDYRKWNRWLKKNGETLIMRLPE